MQNSNTTKKHMRFLPALAVFALACFMRHFRDYMSTYNTTHFALSYDYGFIPRGFMGSVFNFVGELLPYDIHNYIGVNNFNGFFTLVYFLVLFWFYKVCLKHCAEENRHNLKHLIVFLSLFAFTMWTTSVNFGRLDLYLFIFMLISVILIIEEKLEWLIVPMGIICTCIQPDYVYTNANTILVLLLYKIFLGDSKKRKKYIAIFVLYLLSISTLFLYFEFYCQINGEAIVDEIKLAAKALSKSGKSYNASIINQEILGLDISEAQLEYHLQNAREFPVFCILFAPYIFFGFRFFIKLILEKSASLKKRFVYFAFLSGGITMIPLFLSKVDYGSYIFNLTFYYVSLLIVALAMKDRTIEYHLETLKGELKKLTPLTFVWFLYPFLLTPFRTVTISYPIKQLAEILADPEISFFLQIK